MFRQKLVVFTKHTLNTKSNVLVEECGNNLFKVAWNLLYWICCDEM